jgi:hypothetical protein
MQTPFLATRQIQLRQLDSLFIKFIPAIYSGVIICLALPFMAGFIICSALPSFGFAQDRFIAGL